MGEAKNRTENSEQHGNDYASYLNNKTIGGVQHISHEDNENEKTVEFNNLEFAAGEPISFKRIKIPHAE